MKKAYIYVICAVLMWSCMATVSKLLLSTLEPMFVLFYTCLFASITLILYSHHKHSLGGLFLQSPKTIARMSCVGSLGVFFYNLFYFMGTARLSAQTAFVINDLWPVLIIIFSSLLLKKKITIGNMFAIIFSFAGVIIIAFSNGTSANPHYISVTGILFCLLDAICYALFCTINTTETYNKDLAVLISYIFATILSFAYLFITHSLRLPSRNEIIGLIINGVICNAIPYLLWVHALDIGNTYIIANMAYLTPCLSLFVTHYVLNEAITITSIIGLLIILLGVILQSIIIT